MKLLLFILLSSFISALELGHVKIQGNQLALQDLSLDTDLPATAANPLILPIPYKTVQDSLSMEQFFTLLPELKIRLPVLSNTLLIHMDVLIPKGETCSQPIQIQYNSSLNVGTTAVKLISCQGLPQGVFTTWTIALPYFKSEERVADLSFDLSETIEQKLIWDRQKSTESMTLLTYPDLTEITSIRIRNLSLEESIPLERQSVLQTIKLPFWLEAFSVSLVIVLVCLILLSLSIASFFRLRLQFLLFFSSAFLSWVVFFLIQKTAFFENAEGAAFIQKESYLRGLMNRATDPEAMAAKLVQDFNLLVERSKNRLIATSDEADLARYLEEEMHQTKTRLTLVGKEKIYAPRSVLSKEKIKSIQRLLYPVMELKFSSQGVTEETAERVQRGIASLREFFLQSFQSTRNLDEVLNRPNTVQDNSIGQNFGRYNQQQSIWSTFETSKGDFFLALGIFQEELLLPPIIETVTTIATKSAVESFIHGMQLRDCIPAENENRGHFAEITARAHSSTDAVLSYVNENEKLYLYLSRTHPLLSSYVITLRLDCTPVLQESLWRKQMALLLSFGLLVLAFFLCHLLSGRISASLISLHHGFVRMQSGDFSKPLYIAGFDQIAHLGKLIDRLQKQLSEKRILERFLSSAARDQLQAEGPKDAVFEKVTVLYARIADYEPLLAEKTGNQSTLNALFCRLSERIVEHKGFVDKFTGPSLLCVFRDKDGFQNALDTALQIRPEIALWNQDRAKEDKPGVHISIGLAKGSVVLGHVGSPERKDFTVIGSVVNLAARLSYFTLEQSRPESGPVQILIDQEGVELNREFVLHSQVKLKGFEGMRKVLEV